MNGPERSCGACTLCCTLLRVDELGKLGGEPCAKLRAPGEPPGCSIHASRPSICRRYRCLWLQGGLEEQDRPDRLGAVLDLLTRAGTTHLAVHAAAPDACERSTRLAAIVERNRAFQPVRITDSSEVMDPDALVRVLLPGGQERRVRGDRVEHWQDGRLEGERRSPWIQRISRRLLHALDRRRLARAGRNRMP